MKNKLIKMMKTLIIAAGAFSIFLTPGWSFFEITVHCKEKKSLNKNKKFKLYHTKINHPRHKFEKEYNEGKAWCQEQKMQDCYMKSEDGLQLHGLYLPAENAKRIILLCHGYKGSGFGDFANIARFLHENHCNLLFIDQRCCGESEGEFITFGAKEQYDVRKWAYFISKRNKDKLPIYLFGESMGAASVLMASGHKLPHDVRGLIADCGFHSMKGQLEDIASNWFHLNWIELLLFRMNLFCRLIGGFSMKESDTTKALKANRRPVLFFHGSKDTYVVPGNSQINHSLCQAPKELVIIPEARHLCSAYEAPELYREKLLSFFNKYD